MFLEPARGSRRVAHTVRIRRGDASIACPQLGQQERMAVAEPAETAAMDATTGQLIERDKRGLTCYARLQHCMHSAGA